jgi:hypothetical protein
VAFPQSITPNGHSELSFPEPTVACDDQDVASILSIASATCLATLWSNLEACPVDHLHINIVFHPTQESPNHGTHLVTFSLHNNCSSFLADPNITH